MALAASMPVITDLTMKFSSHSLHESFQLPASFYQCIGQAKDIAFYLQPNGFFASPKLGQGTLFEFKGSSNDSTKQPYENKDKRQCEKSTFASVCSKRSASVEEETTVNTNQTTNANPAKTSSDKDTTDDALKTTFQEESDEETCSDEEELTSYFSRQPEPFGECSTPNRLRDSETSNSRISHNRKRSMEQEEYSTTKRCCRPRLNFDKMQQNREIGRHYEEKENCMNYFRPISSHDLIS